jgi:hypothetical protein
MKKPAMKCRTCGARICQHASKVIDEYIVLALAVEKTEHEPLGELHEVGPDHPSRKLQRKILELLEEERVVPVVAYEALLFCVRLVEQKYGFTDNGSVVVVPPGPPQ